MNKHTQYGHLCSRSLFPNPTKLNARFWRGKRIGLFGGSFHPPHSGHLLIAHEALNRFDLDCIWWMVSPKNPLKSTSGHDDFNERLQITADFINHPKMVATDIEVHLHTKNSYQTVKALKNTFPDTDFIWVAGMDNAQLFHRWNDWKKLTQLIPFVFFNRPPLNKTMHKTQLHMNKDLRHIYHFNRMHTNTRPPHLLKPGTIHWVYKGPCLDISSTRIRQGTHI